MKRSKICRPRRPEVTHEEEQAQLTMLRELVRTVATKPLMAEFAPAIAKMLDAGQIIFTVVRKGRKHEKVFTARATPAEMADLLATISHPIPYAILEYFFAGLLYITSVEGDEETLVFTSSEDLIKQPMHLVFGKIYSSGVPKPTSMEGAMQRTVSELAVAEALGFSTEPSADGWLRLCIGDRSIAVVPLSAPDAPLAYDTPDGPAADIVVATYPDAKTLTVHIIGWTDKETFRKKHKCIERGSARCVLPRSDLFPFDDLIALAAKFPSRSVQ